MSSNELLQKLKEASKNIHKTSYDQILQYWDNFNLPFLQGIKLKPGYAIYRARPTESEDFEDVEQLSYNKNPAKFGRANRPGSPMFYGSLATKPDDEPMLTNIMELLEISPHLGGEGQVDYTIGQWIVEKEIYALLMIFNKDYLSKIKHFKVLHDNFVKDIIMTSPVNMDAYKILEYIALEYAKPSMGDDNNYKISAAFFEKMLERSQITIDAIIYPSVKCEGEDFNISLTPDAADTKLMLSKVIVDRYYLSIPDKVYTDSGVKCTV